MIELQETTADLIDSFGRKVTLRRTSETSTDGTKPWSSEDDAVTFTDVTVKAVFSDEAVALPNAGPSGPRGRGAVTFVRTTVMIAAKGLTSPPSVADMIVDGDAEYLVETVETAKPGDTAYYYKLEVTS